MYRVSGQKVNVRSAATTKSSIVGSLLHDQQVEVKSISNGWATVDYKGATRYVSASYLEKVEDQVFEEEVEEETEEEEEFVAPTTVRSDRLAEEKTKSSKQRDTKEDDEDIKYFRMGLDMSKPVGDDVGKYVNGRPCYDLAFGFQNNITKGLYWGMEFALGSRGYKLVYDGYVEEKFIGHNVRWTPFQIGYKYEVVKNLKLDAHLGSFASFDYLGSVSDDEEPISIWDDEVDGFNHFDAGIQLGFGVWYKKFNLDVTWQRGFMKMFDEADVYNRGIMLRLGIGF